METTFIREMSSHLKAQEAVEIEEDQVNLYSHTRVKKPSMKLFGSKEHHKAMNLEAREKVYTRKSAMKTSFTCSKNGDKLPSSLKDTSK
jgi:hypothetical protein